MDEVLKKEIWKVFSVAAFLFITIFFALPYLVQVSTYFHEQAHLNSLEKYSVEAKYDVDWLMAIPNFFNPHLDNLGVTRFSFSEYNRLDKYQRTVVHIGGIISDLRFLFLIGVYLTFANIYFFYKIRFKEEYDIRIILAVNWILFMWLLALIQITISNITQSSGDIFQLVRFLRI